MFSCRSSFLRAGVLSSMFTSSVALRDHPWRSVDPVTSGARDSVPTVVTTAHLSVRPRVMATGTQTRVAGLQLLDSTSGTWIYVPARCIGTRRAPLVVYLGGAGHDAKDVIAFQRQFADQYGMILLAPNAVDAPGRWDVMASINGGAGETAPQTGTSLHVLKFTDPDVRHIDAALQRVLRDYAIDPDRIALAGFSNGGSYALFLGRSNPDIFSRIAPLSALIPFAGLGAAVGQHPSTRFFLSGGLGEDMVEQTLQVARELRQQGYAVQTVLGLREHVEYQVDNAYMWAWLARSWTSHTRVADVAPRAPADSDPVLTAEVLQKMTDFWRRFQREPDAIRTIGRLAHQAPILLWIGSQPAAVLKTDMIALAKRYPSVTADLHAAGLTAPQEEAYRAALIRVECAGMSPRATGEISPASVLGRNFAFWKTHAPAFTALENTGMFVTQ